VRPGDEIVISRPLGRRQTVVIDQLAERSIPKAEARRLYVDRTPGPSPDEIEARRMERIFRALNPAAHAPNKRERRQLRKLRGR
jgi:ribosome-associated heat shock protein Hsp15